MGLTCWSSFEQGDSSRPGALANAKRQRDQLPVAEAESAVVVVLPGQNPAETNVRVDALADTVRCNARGAFVVYPATYQVQACWALLGQARRPTSALVVLPLAFYESTASHWLAWRSCPQTR
jgi:hypothetical protein